MTTAAIATYAYDQIVLAPNRDGGHLGTDDFRKSQKSLALLGVCEGALRAGGGPAQGSHSRHESALVNPY